MLAAKTYKGDRKFIHEKCYFFSTACNHKKRYNNCQMKKGNCVSICHKNGGEKNA